MKLTAPLGTRHTVRVFGLHSSERRLLFDPLYKYDPGFAPARRVNGRLLSAHLQRAPDPQSTGGLVADLRVGYFDREFARGQLERPVGAVLHPFSGHPFRIAGEDIARRQDTLAGGDPIPGLSVPDWSESTPWGVPAFFRGQGSRGEVSWNRFRELRTQLDLSIGAEKDLDLYVGGELVSQRVQTFQRAFGYLASGAVGADTAPPPTASDFRPLSGAAYLEAQFRWEDLAFNWGLRYDQFDPRADLAGSRIGPRRSLNPRFAVSTVLKNATFVASWGRFSQAPDFQYLVDAAFDDSARTGRFRRGNPNLGYENSSQYEFSLRVRTSEHVSLRFAAYVRQLNGLVASVPLGVNPDSTIFGNTDYGNVKGFELLAERDLAGWFGIRLGYSFQTATATATNAFQLLRRIRLDPTGDTIFPARVEFPLDYDRRHGVTAIFQLTVPDSVAVPDEITRRLIRGMEAAA
ncbi:MAG: outer membrane beta-barrel protein, partial [Gemmatimonadales bacterium]